MSNGTFSSRSITKVTNWWGRRGQKALPEFYFLPTTIFTIVAFISIFYGIILYTMIFTIVRFSMQDMLLITIKPLTLWDNLFIASSIIVSALLFFGLLYLRQMIAYTLKNELKLRTLILHRTFWKKLAIYTFFTFYIISSLFAVVFTFSMNPPSILSENEVMTEIFTSLTPIFPSYSSLFITITILSVIVALLLSVGVSTKERIEIIANSLTNLDTLKELDSKNFKENLEYLSKDFVRSVSLSFLYRNQFVEEVNLADPLGPLFLALFYGNSQEKDTSKKLLSEIQCDTKSILDYHQFLINWILRVSESFPRLLSLKKT